MPSALDLIKQTPKVTASDLIRHAPESAMTSVTRAVLDKFGLDPEQPGPLESLFGTPEGQGIWSRIIGAVDPALRLGAAPAVGFGEAIKDVTEWGGAGIGLTLHAAGVPVSQGAMQKTETPLSRLVGGAATLAAPFLSRLMPERPPTLPPPRTTIESTPERLRVRVRPLGPETAEVRPVTPGERIGGPIMPESAAIPISEEVAATPGALVDPILKLPVHREVLAAAEDLFAKGGVQRDPNRLISDQVLDLMVSEKLTFPEMEASLSAQGLSFAEFGGALLFRRSITDAARRMAFLKVLAGRVGRIAKTPEAQQELSELLGLATQVDEGARATAWWKRADNIRRALMVSQLTTAVRNFETQVGRVGIDVLDQGLQAALQRAMGVTPTIDPLDGVEVMLNLLRRGTKAQVEDILKAFPAQYDRLFGTYHADLAVKAKDAGAVLSGVDALFTKTENAAAVLNTFNRFQEFLVRRATFAAKLDQGLRSRGMNLERLIAEGRTGTIPKDAIEEAIQRALEMTFAESPKAGTAAADFVGVVNKVPGLTLGIPFPRFMLNQLKFQFEFSPAGFLKLLSTAERDKLAAGDVQTLSRALIGTAMLGAAYQFRKSEWAGERWYEARGPDGTTTDLRPFNPFVSYFFVADVLKRMNDGTLYHLEKKDLAMGILSLSNLRSGSGLFILDKIMNVATDPETLDHLKDAAKGLAGETVASYLTPLRQLADVMAEFDETMQRVRDRKQEPFLGPIKAQIPGLAETLPVVHLPTRSAPLIREQPLLRQITGIIVNTPKNALEKELDRLQFNRQEILPSTGDPKADNLIAKHMGQLAEDRLLPIIEGEKYQQASDALRNVMLREMLTGIRMAAKSLAAMEAPDLFKQIGVPLRERGLVKETGLLPRGGFTIRGHRPETPQ